MTKTLDAGTDLCLKSSVFLRLISLSLSNPPFADTNKRRYYCTTTTQSRDKQYNKIILTKHTEALFLIEVKNLDSSYPSSSSGISGASILGLLALFRTSIENEQLPRIPRNKNDEDISCSSRVVVAITGNCNQRSHRPVACKRGSSRRLGRSTRHCKRDYEQSQCSSICRTELQSYPYSHCNTFGYAFGV